jgi:hypothetical protein
MLKGDHLGRNTSLSMESTGISSLHWACYPSSVSYSSPCGRVSNIGCSAQPSPSVRLVFSPNLSVACHLIQITIPVHQVALSGSPLQAWVLGASRDGLLAQNKEGLASFPGNYSARSLWRAAESLKSVAGAEARARGRLSGHLFLWHGHRPLRTSSRPLLCISRLVQGW